MLGVCLRGCFAAASGQELTWRDPLNLSQTGTTTLPQLFQDNTGQFHLLWQDTFQQTVFYLNGNGTTWSDPVAITPPFSTPLTQSTETNPLPLIAPTFVTDNNGLVHAFWRNNLDELRYSLVALADFADGSQWSTPVTLATNVPAFTAHAADGQLGLLYVVANDEPTTPAGVFYLGSADGGETWDDAAALYSSAYFRLLEPEEFDLSLTAGTRPQTMLATWTDPTQEKIYASQSTANGATWVEPTVIDSREQGDPVNGVAPTQLQLLTQAGLIHRLWRAGHNSADNNPEGQACALYHSWSDDNGLSWSPRSRLLPDNPLCPDAAYLLAGPDETAWLMAFDSTQAILQVWSGTAWGNAESQSPVIQLTDPQTLRPVNLACQQPAINPAGQLVVVGCGGGRGADVWLLGRDLGAVAAWLPQEEGTSSWLPWATIHQDAAAMSHLSLLFDTAGQPHLLWVQPQRRTADNDPGTVFYENPVIYHTARINNSWVAAAPVLASPVGDVEEIAAIINSSDRLLVVWSNPQSGQIYFSQADALDAFDANQWSPPLPLPVPVVSATSPDIGLLPNGTIVVAYTVPINEGRGIYLTTSTNGGFNWSEPVLVFDGAAAGWAMLDQPHLAFTADNHIHLLWRHLSLPPTSESLGLYYAHSLDGGQSWSAPLTIVSAAVVWSDIVGWSSTRLHITWRETQSGRTSLWHILSSDDGLTMERASRVAIIDDTIGPTSLIQDSLGQLHLWQISHPLASPIQVLPFVWSENGWLPEALLEPGLVNVPDNGRMASAVNWNGELLLALAGQAQVEGDEAVWVSGRVVDIPAVTPTPMPTLTPTPNPTSTPVPQLTPTAQPTAPFPLEPSDANSPKIGQLTINSNNHGIVTGFFSAAALVGLIFLLGLLASRARMGYDR